MTPDVAVVVANSSLLIAYRALTSSIYQLAQKFAEGPEVFDAAMIMADAFSHVHKQMVATFGEDFTYAFQQQTVQGKRASRHHGA